MNTRSLHPLRGFTLIEVMVTVAIVAVLAGIALPAYTNYVRRGKLNEAPPFLSDYRIKMEQFYQDNRNYGSSNTCAKGPVTPNWATFVSGAKNFDFTCQLAADAQSYTLIATGKGAAAGYVYTIDSSTSNYQHTTQFKSATVAKDCWLIKGDEC